MKLGLYIHKESKRDIYDETTSIDFTFSFVVVGDNEKITNVSRTFNDEPYRHLADIEVQARLYTGKFNKSDSPYNHYETIYYNGYHPQVDEMEKATKTMKTIHKALDRLNAKRGYPVDFADFIGRVAEVTGCDCFVEKTGGHGSFYNEMTHKLHKLGEGINSLRWEVKNDSIFNKAIDEAMQRAA